MCLARRFLPILALGLATWSVAGASARVPGDPTGVTGECFGQAPTIVGVPSTELEGTEGPDVVITNGATLVQTFGGDDLVCITGVYESTSDGEGRLFATGAGSDRIDSSLAKLRDPYVLFIIAPGPDADEFIGGPAREEVRAQELGLKSSRPDIINTADGDDVVYSRGDDRVSLGAGQDQLQLMGDIRGGAYDGGGTGDSLTANFTKAERASWTFDNRSEKILGAPGHEASMSGFSKFELGVRGDLTFLGNDNRETLSTTVYNPTGYWIPRGGVRIRMGGGNDRITFYGGAPQGRFSGGDGVDTFRYARTYDVTVNSRLPIVFNLSTGRLDDVGPKGYKRRAQGFENADIHNAFCTDSGQCGASRMTLTGTNKANHLRASGFPEQTAPNGIFGRGGDDVLVGSNSSDILVGGSGNDIAKGRGGRDDCSAETQTGCED
jgi:Ca2+-binding RTX toxin-like protein